MGKITIRTPEDSAELFAQGLCRISEGLALIAEGVREFAAHNTDEEFLTALFAGLAQEPPQEDKNIP